MFRNRQKMIQYDPKTPHDGFLLDFIDKCFYDKAPGQAATLYPNLEEWGTFTRGGSFHNYVNATGTIVAGSANIPRYTYNPATLQPRGLLVENTATNLCLDSQTPGALTWTRLTSTITADSTTAPDGTTTADSLVEDATAASEHTGFQSISFTTGTRYTVSIWAKANSRGILWMELPASVFTAACRVYFNLSTGAVGTASGSPVHNAIEAYPNGWYRCSFSKVSTATTSGSVVVGLCITNGTPSYNGDGASNIFIWGAQVEATSSASSYIPTTGATQTRTGDVLTKTLASRTLANQIGIFDGRQGSSYIEMMTPVSNPVQNTKLIHIGTPGTAGEMLRLNNGSSSMQITEGAGSATAGSALTGTFFAFSSQHGIGDFFCTSQGSIGFSTTAWDGAFGDNTDTTLDGWTNTSDVAPLSTDIFYIKRFEYWPYTLGRNKCVTLASKVRPQ